MKTMWLGNELSVATFWFANNTVSCTLDQFYFEISLFIFVLLPDGLLRVLVRVGEWLVETDEALLEVVDPQAGLLNHPRIPGGQAQGVASERDAGGAYHRWNEVQVGLRVQQAQLGQVLREELDLALVCKGAT